VTSRKCEISKPIENVANFATAGLQQILAAMNAAFRRNHFIRGHPQIMSA